MFSKALKSNLVYALGSVANTAALFLLVPFLVNKFTVVEFGIWSLLEASILILGIFLSAGLDVGLMRYYWFLESEDERSRLAGTVIITVLVWVFVITGIFAVLILIGVFDQLIHCTIQALLLALLSAFAENVFRFFLTLSRIRQEAIRFVKLSFGRMILFMASSIVLVYKGFGLEGALAGRALASVLALLAGFIFYRRYFSLSFDRIYLKRVVKYSLPLIPASLSGYVLLTSGKYFLQIYCGAAVVGIYSFAYKLAAGLDVVINRPFSLDWAPRRFIILKNEDAPQRYADVLLIYSYFAVLAVIGILAVAPIVYEWIAPATYIKGINVLPLLLLAYLVYGLSYPLTVGIVIKDKTSYAATIGIVAMVICLCLNSLLIPQFGMIGAGWAAVISYSIWTGGMALASLRLYPIPYSVKELAIIYGTGMIGYAGLSSINQIAWANSSSILCLAIRLAWVSTLFGVLGIIIIRRMH